MASGPSPACRLMANVTNFSLIPSQPFNQLKLEGLCTAPVNVSLALEAFYVVQSLQEKKSLAAVRAVTARRLVGALESLNEEALDSPSTYCRGILEAMGG